MASRYWLNTTRRSSSLAEVYSRTILPEIVPIAVAGCQSFGESRQSIGRCIDSRFTLEYSSGKSGRKLARKSEFIFRRCQYKIVCRLLLEGSFSFPTQRYIINGRIECTFENCTLRILKDYICSVFVVGIPIAGIIGMSACRVWSFTPARAGLVILAEIMSICG